MALAGGIHASPGTCSSLICMHCFETNTCAFLDTISLDFTDVWCDTRVILNDLFATFLIRIWWIHFVFICFTYGVMKINFDRSVL